MKGSAGVAIKRILPRLRRFAMPLEPLTGVTVGSFGRPVGNASVTFLPVHATPAFPGREPGHASVGRSAAFEGAPSSPDHASVNGSRRQHAIGIAAAPPVLPRRRIP